MLRFYFNLGADIVNKKAESRWGDGFFKNLSLDMQNALPGVKGFSVTNLKYTKLFYQLYNQLFTISPHDGDQLSIFQISWSHHKYIIDKCKKDTDKALFYVNKTLENNWSRSVLLNFLDTDLYERQGKAISNFTKTLPSPQSDLAQQITKDPYIIDIMGIRQDMEEKEIEAHLDTHISQYLLELGKGFTYYGHQVHLNVGGEDFYIDQLFYNVRLHCYVVVELKSMKFKPEHIGQLNFYVSAVDNQMRTDKDNPTIGLLI